MMWRVVKSTERGYVIASRDFYDIKECCAECLDLAANSDDFFAVQEQPSGSIVCDAQSIAKNAPRP